ncbi:MAG TPA: SIMPL domain-containing protein [Candidatus Agrococcus pullicola]|uniref:SIMPL domain-containing protein n=1 Tax=Candidatus Agrococcus pullicola TaxID=2838429 RepID=A0A9D1YVS2_9MICO|nr:SIMPL domain-containing protein [Candidatus Agrococcus pullicola]
MTLIHAVGTSESHYRAERATVTARISISSADRAESIAKATALHNRVAGRAQELRAGGDATWHAADPLSTWARKSFAEGSKSKVIIEHITSSVVRVKLSNLSIVGEIVAELAAAGAETRVDWSLTEDFKRQCERRARTAAVGEARQVADDYAEALGERVERVVSISDAQAGFGGAHPRAGAAGSAEAQVTVAEITVRASVKGEFETVAP